MFFLRQKKVSPDVPEGEYRPVEEQLAEGSTNADDSSFENHLSNLKIGVYAKDEEGYVKVVIHP